MKQQCNTEYEALNVKYTGKKRIVVLLLLSFGIMLAE